LPIDLDKRVARLSSWFLGDLVFGLDLILRSE